MRYAVCAVALLSACATSSRSTSEAPPATSVVAEPERGGITFIENDYAGALERARAEGRPLFVDVWAPW